MLRAFFKGLAIEVCDWLKWCVSELSTGLQGFKEGGKMYKFSEINFNSSLSGFFNFRTM